MAVSSHDDFTRMLLQALGVAGREVTAITIKFKVDEPVIVEVERFLTRIEAHNLQRAIDEFTFEASGIKRKKIETDGK